MEIQTVQSSLSYQRISQTEKNPSQIGQEPSEAAQQQTRSRDEYISSEEGPQESGGIYQVMEDGSGNRKIMFDDPEAGEEEKVKECTMNTDKVDREIEKLKEEKRQLEQEIRAASGDEEKVKKLKQKLAAIESELSQKDNDTYRRQHAEVS